MKVTRQGVLITMVVILSTAALGYAVVVLVPRWTRDILAYCNAAKHDPAFTCTMQSGSPPREQCVKKDGNSTWTETVTISRDGCKVQTHSGL